MEKNSEDKQTSIGHKKKNFEDNENSIKDAQKNSKDTQQNVKDKPKNHTGGEILVTSCIETQILLTISTGNIDAISGAQLKCLR